MNLLYQVCPELNEQYITEEEIMQIKRDVEEKLEDNESILKSLTVVYSFIGNKHATKIYEQLKDIPNERSLCKACHNNYRMHSLPLEAD